MYICNNTFVYYICAIDVDICGCMVASSDAVSFSGEWRHPNPAALIHIQDKYT